MTVPHCPGEVIIWVQNVANTCGGVIVIATDTDQAKVIGGKRVWADRLVTAWTWHWSAHASGDIMPCPPCMSPPPGALLLTTLL